MKNKEHYSHELGTDEERADENRLKPVHTLLESQVKDAESRGSAKMGEIVDNS